MAEAAKKKLLIWKADIASKIKTIETGIQKGLPNIQTKVDQQESIPLDRLELMLLYRVRSKVYEKVQENINLVFADIPLIFSGNASEEDLKALQYLKSVTLADKLKQSKDWLEPTLKKVKISQIQPDAEIQYAYGSTKFTAEDAIKYTNELADEIGDPTFVLLRALSTSPKYKSKVLPVIQSKKAELQEQQQIQQQQQMSQQPNPYGMLQNPMMMQPQHVAYGYPSPVNSNDPMSSPHSSQYSQGPQILPPTIPLDQPKYPSTDQFYPNMQQNMQSMNYPPVMGYPQMPDYQNMASGGVPSYQAPPMQPVAPQNQNVANGTLEDMKPTLPPNSSEEQKSDTDTSDDSAFDVKPPENRLLFPPPTADETNLPFDPTNVPLDDSLFVSVSAKRSDVNDNK